MKKLLTLTALLLALSAPVAAQTPANRLRYGPTTSGVSCNPATGDVFKLSVPPYTVYHCTATNTWSPVGGGATTLDGLTDAQVSSPAAGHTLVFDGSLFVNRALTKADVGLGKVDNTSDPDKPISTATQTALDLKATTASVTAEASARAAADALLQPLSEKNQNGGYAGLDGSGLLPDNRVPAGIARDSEVTAAVSAEATVRDTAISTASTADRARSNHTGTQLAATISDFASAVAANLPANIVNTFNTRTGAVTLTSLDVSTALGFTPRDAAASTVNTFNTRAGAVTLTSGDVTGALAFTPLDAAATTYALLAGRAGGQTLNGGTGSGDSLTLNSTSHATKGKIFFGANSAYDGALTNIGLGTTSPAAHGWFSGGRTLHIYDNVAGYPSVRFQNSTNDATVGIDAGSLYFYTGLAKSYRFYTGGNEKVTIDTAGLVGLNKVSAIGAQLHVVSGAAGTPTAIFQLAASPTADAVKVRNSASADLYRVTKEGEPYPVTQGTGVILRDTDGAGCHRITVNTAGTITATAITCP